MIKTDMAYGFYNYLHLGEKVDPNKYLVATFYVESVLPLEKAAEAIASESSVGTWTGLSTMHKEIIKDKAARVIEIDKKKNIVKIAYPNCLWEDDNIAQLLSGIAGNIFGLKELTQLKLLDIQFTARYVKRYEGPSLGIYGVREILNIYDRPLLGTIIKPKVGLDPAEHAKVAYEAWVGGVDVVKDDENLASMSFNNFYRRVKLTLEMKRRAELETGEKKLYLPNITARPTEMYRRAQFVREQGGNAVMIDILTAGLSSVQEIRNYDFNIAIHGHRAMHAAFTRNPKYGISMLVVAKLARLAGTDNLHIGTVIGKMEGGLNEILTMHNFLKSPWFGLNSVFHVASGGLHPGHVSALLEILEDYDVIINMGGGIHGHPKGTRIGAMAARQAIDIALKRLDVKRAVQDSKYKEFAEAINKWGYVGKNSQYIIKPQEVGVTTYKNTMVN